MEPYENIVIGNFLYSLGLMVGQGSTEKIHSMCVNLMQQTPLDKPLGDVMVANKGVTRLIEFKRSEHDPTKEETKRQILCRELDGNEHMLEVSREIHWYIETSEDRQNLVSRVVPYIDFYNKSIFGPTVEHFTASIALDATSKIIDDDTQADYKKYLAAVAAAHGGFQGASGGIVINLSKESGLRYFLISDIRDLLLNDRLVREAYFKRIKQHIMDLERTHILKRSGLSIRKYRPRF